MKDITAVLAINGKLELTKTFLKYFRERFPDVPLAVSCLQGTDGVPEYLKYVEKQDPYTRVIIGNPKDGHHVSFSENYDAAINLVKTPKMVVVHTDMVFCEGFFDELSRILTTPKEFYVYTTIEPPVYIGHRRPGKIIGDFGESFDTFKLHEFDEHVETLKSKPAGNKPGYGFFLAGYTDSWKDIGGYDFHHFTPVFCEDDDLMVRLRTKGYHAYVADHAICYHLVSQTCRTMSGAAMSAGEVNSNRSFAKKWGFEARFLWQIEYDKIPGSFKIYDRNISYNPTWESKGQVETVLPLFTSIGDSGDIVVESISKDHYNFNRIAEIAGTLKLSNSLVPGVYEKKGVRVIVKNVDSSKLLLDNTNYLSLQKEIEYE